MRCLVTGVAGFIGSHLAERLLREGHEVLGIDAFIPYYPRVFKEGNLHPLRASEHFRFMEADLNSCPLAELMADRDWVFHQAAQAGVRQSWGEHFDLYVTCNITATQRLLEAAMKTPTLKRFVYASSSSIYGDVRTFPVTEDHPTRPVSPYGVTKLAAELLCFLAWYNYRVPTVSLRYFTVYGPRHRPDMAFHRFIKALLANDEVVIYGDGQQTRDFTYVSDAVEANIRAATAPGVEGLAFNIAGGSHASIREAIGIMESLSGRPARIRFEAGAAGDVRDTLADTSRAQQLLGFTPRVPLREGLEAELAFLEQVYATAAPSSSYQVHL
jgi:nucleoside-diphosphate-sugar epimerase